MSRRLPLHVLLFALFPSLFLFVHNLEFYSARVLPLPLAASLALAGALFALFCLVARDRVRAAVLTGLTLMLFFSYGHVYQLLAGIRIRLGPILLGPHRTLFLVWGLAWLAALRAVLRARRPPEGLNAILNVVAAALIGITALNFAARAIGGPKGSAAGPAEAAWEAAPVTAGARPDIYYIILDGYGRGDVLANLYRYDDRPLLDDLRARGFFVAEHARANYMQTSLSLASSLNLDYLDPLAARLGPDSQNRNPLMRMIQHSALGRFLARRGYATVAFATGYWTTEIRDADLYLSPGFSLNEFQSTLLGTTPLPAVMKILGRGSQAKWHRDRIRFTLDRLPRLREEAPAALRDRPLFVFAHIVCPHPPFVFGADCGEGPAAPFYTMADGSDLLEAQGISREEYVERYRGQIACLDAQVRRMLDGLAPRAGGGRPALIVLQSDHGPGSRLLWEDAAGSDARERLGILSAFRFPDGDSARPGDGATPVNTFRLVLGRYFGVDLPPLPARSYFSTSSRPYRFIDVTERVLAQP